MDYRGQQIFIVHPHSESRNGLVRLLRRSEFATFGIGELNLGLLARRRESILFLFVASEEGWDWRAFADALLLEDNPPALVALGAGKAPDGFVAAVSESDTRAISGIEIYLKNIGARGHRNYVRFGTQNASIATFEFHRDNRRYAGIVHDISVAGISCTFRPEPPNLSDRNVDRLQLNLPEHRIVLSGRFTTYRVVAGQQIHVFLFDRNSGEETRDSIYEFIYSSLEMKLSLH